MSANSANVKDKVAASNGGDHQGGFYGNIKQSGGFPLICLSSANRRQFKNYLKTAATISTDFVFMKSSTRDKIKGTFNEAKGKVKEKTGNATGNPDLRDRGTVEKASGKIQRKIGDVKKVFEE